MNKNEFYELYEKISIILIEEFEFPSQEIMKLLQFAYDDEVLETQLQAIRLSIESLIYHAKSKIFLTIEEFDKKKQKEIQTGSANASNSHLNGDRTSQNTARVWIHRFEKND